MPSALYGKWKLTKSDNFDEYMKAVGEYKQFTMKLWLVFCPL